MTKIFDGKLGSLTTMGNVLQIEKDEYVAYIERSSFLPVMLLQFMFKFVETNILCVYFSFDVYVMMTNIIIILILGFHHHVFYILCSPSYVLFSSLSIMSYSFLLLPTLLSSV